MNLYEVDTVRGGVYQLSRFACGRAPTGGEVVYASNSSEAQELWFRYRAGERNLKGTIMIEGQDYPYRNIICEAKYHINEKDDENDIMIDKVVLPNQLKLFIADIVDEETKEQEIWYVVDKTYDFALEKFIESANKVWDRYAYYFFEADEEAIMEFMSSHENIEMNIYC